MSIHWAGGRTSPPPDTPACGFDNSLCKSKPVVRAILILFLLYTHNGQVGFTISVLCELGTFFLPLFVFRFEIFSTLPSANKNKFPFFFSISRVTSVPPTLAFPFRYYLYYLFICFVNPLAQCRRQKFDFSVQFPLLDIKKIIATLRSVYLTIRLYPLPAITRSVSYHLHINICHFFFFIYIHLIVQIFFRHIFIFVPNVHRSFKL